MPQMTITPELLSRMNENYHSRPELEVLSHALTNTTMTDAAFIPANAAKLRMDFSITVPTTGITNQKSSGRCWMFASMNLLRERIVKKLNLSEFGLSGTYLAFYDKLEKANNFFEAVLTYADEPVNSRSNQLIFKAACADGGQWDMFTGLVRKYGLVPEWVMPETIHSTGTSEWITVMAEQLHEYGLELRRMQAEGLDVTARRQEMLMQYYNSLCIVYGEPPKSFHFDYTDKDGNFHIDRNLTPQDFFLKYAGDDLDDYCCVIASPIHELHKTYDQPFMGNIVEDRYKWLNVTMEELETMSIEMLKSGEGVMFSCDCHPYRNRPLGYWDQDSMDYASVLGGLTLGMTKAEKLMTGTSNMNHCMMLCGVNMDENGNPDRWKIENSWGDASGQKGYFVCSEKWFKEYVLQVIVRKSFLTDEQKVLFEQEPLHMNFWDPLA